MRESHTRGRSGRLSVAAAEPIPAFVRASAGSGRTGIPKRTLARHGAGA